MAGLSEPRRKPRPWARRAARDPPRSALNSCDGTGHRAHRRIRHRLRSVPARARRFRGVPTVGFDQSVPLSHGGFMLSAGDHSDDGNEGPVTAQSVDPRELTGDRITWLTRGLARALPRIAIGDLLHTHPELFSGRSQPGNGVWDLRAPPGRAHRNSTERSAQQPKPGKGKSRPRTPSSRRRWNGRIRPSTLNGSSLSYPDATAAVQGIVADQMSKAAANSSRSPGSTRYRTARAPERSCSWPRAARSSLTARCGQTPAASSPRCCAWSSGWP
jgi:hypothetical protein